MSGKRIPDQNNFLEKFAAVEGYLKDKLQLYPEPGIVEPRQEEITASYIKQEELRCGRCDTPAESEDIFCGNCGNKLQG